MAEQQLWQECGESEGEGTVTACRGRIVGPRTVRRVSPSALLIEDGLDAAVERAVSFVRYQRRNGLVPRTADIVRAALGNSDPSQAITSCRRKGGEEEPRSNEQEDAHNGR